MTNLDSILKSRDITFSTKVHIIKAITFPVVMYRYESWTLKQAACWRIDAFELWCWRRLLRVLWTARRWNNPKGNQSWIFIRRNDVETEVPILWPPDAKSWKRPWGWERLKAGGEGGGRGQDGWIASLTQWTWVWASSGRGWRKGKPGMLQSMGLQRDGHDWVTEQQQFCSTYHDQGTVLDPRTEAVSKADRICPYLRPE